LQVTPEAVLVLGLAGPDTTRSGRAPTWQSGRAEMARLAAPIP
jgi:hypothetical protein